MSCPLIRLIAVFLTTAVFTLQPSKAAEIDSVTPRRIHLDDSLQEINAMFNQRILEGIAKANAKREDFEDLTTEEFCNEEILYAEMRKAIFQSFTASWGLKGYSLDKQLRELLADRSYSLSLNDSIYRDMSYVEGFSLNLKELSDVVRVRGHLVGLDKLGHFFSEGWKYFEINQKESNSLDQVLQWGKAQENGIYGYTTTGIYSFADLVANFNGLRFWNRVLGKDSDPLLGFMVNLFDRPYVTCDVQLIASIKHLKIVKAWERNRKFDLAVYLDGAWDEGNNCNSYANPQIEAKVSSRIMEVDSGFNCPVVPETCLEAQQKYGKYAKELLHPSCLVVQEHRGVQK